CTVVLPETGHEQVMDADPTDLRWLQEIQQSDATTGSPNQSMQGMLLETIPLPHQALDGTDDCAVIEATIDFTNWALEEAFLVPGEFPQQALWAYHIACYRAHVHN